MNYKYNSIFQIPERNLSQQKLTKAFFLRNFDLSSAEKKLLNDSIVQMEILAQILPEQSNIPAIVNDKESYEQILTIVCTVADNQLEAVAEKCIQLLQKYISHQILLIIEDANEFIINVSEKRINQNDKTRLTVERYYTTAKLSKLYKNEVTASFFKALDFSTLDKTNLELLYKSYIHAVIQYQAANITGSFKKRNNARSMADMANLEAIEKLESEIVTLSNQIKKENQLNQIIPLNIEIRNKRKEVEKFKTLINEH